MRLWFGNLLIVTLSLGLLTPLAWIRKGLYISDNLRFVGRIDLAVLAQEEFEGEAAAEGFLGDFDLS